MITPERIAPPLYNSDSGYIVPKNILTSSLEAPFPSEALLPSAEILIELPTDIVKLLFTFGSKLECGIGENELILKKDTPTGGSKVHTPTATVGLSTPSRIYL